MKIASLILGIIGGLAGICGALFALGVGGVSSAFEMKEASTVVGLGLSAIPLSILGIVGGALVMAKPKPAGIMMLIAGIGGIIAIFAGYIVAGPLLIIGGILALISSGKEKKSELQESKQIKVIGKKKFTWIFWVLGVIIVLIILSAIGSKTEEKGKIVSASHNLKEQIQPSKQPAKKESSNPLIGKWELVSAPKEGFGEWFAHLEIYEDGKVIFREKDEIIREGKYTVKGDKWIRFDVKEVTLKSLGLNEDEVLEYALSDPGAEIDKEKEEKILAYLNAPGSYMFNTNLEFLISLTGKELTIFRDAETMSGMPVFMNWEFVKVE